MTDGEARNMEVSFSFLDEDAYSIEIFKDGVNLNRYASDYKHVVNKQVGIKQR